MATKSWVSLVFSTAIAAAATGCGGGAPGFGGARAAAPSSAPQSASMEAEAGGGAVWEDAEAAPPPAAQAAPGAPPREAFEEAERRADTSVRPGLGTEWGENRTSRVSSAPFFREDPDRPFAMAKLFYNDAEGVRAMARRSGFSSLGESESSVGRGALTVRLLDSSGRSLEGFSTGGATHVVGEHGQRYILQIQNHTGSRLEAVATVDGLDVINGQAGSFSNRGYIVAPFSTVEIDGFRRSMDTVAAFRFGAVKNSYAAKKGGDRNVGVIGVAFFHERGSRFPWTEGEIRRRRDANPFPGEFAEPPPGSF
jgi:hypothetical protein